MKTGLGISIDVRRPGFRPTQVGGCTLWLPSDPGYMAADGSQWTNAVDSTLSFTATLTARPTLVTSGINGRPVFRFNGTANRLTGPGTTNPFFSAANAYVFMAFKVTSITLNNATPVYNNDALFSDGGADYGAALQNTGGGTLRSYHYDGTYDEPTAIAAATGGTYVLTWKHTGGNVSHQVNNGTAQATASGNTAALTSAMQICSSQSIRFAAIDLMEVVAFNAALSATDEARVRSWLMTRAGL